MKKGESAMEDHRYDDIIDLPRPVSLTHPRMARADRAAQFSPFAALTGYSDAIREVERTTDGWVPPDEEALARLGEQISRLAAEPCGHTEATLTFFVPDLRKEGGVYRRVRGRIRRVDQTARLLVLEDGSTVSFDAVVSLELSGQGGA